MLPKAPAATEDYEAIIAYRERLRDYAHTLRNRTFREFYRKDLARRARLYKTLAKKNNSNEIKAQFFSNLAQVHWDELERYGSEPVPRSRQKKLGTVPLRYPHINAAYSNKMHFISTGSLRRERTAAFAKYADASSCQDMPNGHTLLTVAIDPSKVRLFERMVESVGPDNLRIKPSKSGGFKGYVRKDGSFSDNPEWDNECSPWRRIREDNFRAGLYHWSRRRGHLAPEIELPSDRPPMPQSLPWDPEPTFNKILNLTQNDQLIAAARLVDVIPIEERELLFDEVIYLRYLIGQPPTGGDILYLVRRYLINSSIRDRLEEELTSYLLILDQVLCEAGPLPDGFPALPDLRSVLQDDPDPLKRNTPPLNDWKATREHYYKQYEAYGQPVRPRGRLFIWHPDIGANCFSQLYHGFQPELVKAENQFRRERSIAEVGKGWVSETSLLDLVRQLYPEALHQWRPSFLGLQSVDIYIPELNLAIEYQGEQHYRPVDIFGGEEGYNATRLRDERKKRLLWNNNVPLLEWPYDRKLTRDEVQKALYDFKPV